MATLAYADLEDCREYVSARGFSLPEDDTEAGAIVLRAEDAFDAAYSDCFVGTAADPLYAWPRVSTGDAALDGTIPAAVPVAVYQYVLEMLRGIPLEQAEATKAVTRERIDQDGIETYYAVADATNRVSGSAKLPSATALLERAGLINYCNGQLTAVRG